MSVNTATSPFLAFFTPLPSAPPPPNLRGPCLALLVLARPLPPHTPVHHTRLLCGLPPPLLPNPPTPPHLRGPRLERLVLCGRLKAVYVAVHGGEQQVQPAVTIQVISQDLAVAGLTYRQQQAGAGEGEEAVVRLCSWRPNIPTEP